MIIKVKNDQTEGAPKTYLSSALAASGTTVTVKGINGFYDNWNVQIGETGESQTQVIEIQGAPSGFAINLAGTIKDAHPADTPVYCIKYNQAIFYRNIAGTTGDGTVMADGTIGIMANSEYTIFDDASGSTSYGYQAVYHSTGLNADSSLSDYLTPAGHDFYSLGSLKQRVKGKLLNPADITDENLKDWANEWLEKMNNTVIDVNEDFAIGTVDVAFSGTAQYGSITSADFVQIRRVWYTENGVDWFQMTKQMYTDFLPEQVFNETHPYYHMKGDDEIGRNPHEVSGTTRISYYKLRQQLDSDGDLLPFPMRGYSNSFVKWMLAQAYRKDNKIPEARELEGQAEADRTQFEKELVPRNKSGATYIKIVESFDDGDVSLYR